VWLVVVGVVVLEIVLLAGVVVQVVC